jgi:hypothetical protein
LHLASGELLLRLPDDPEPGTVARVLELDGTFRADRPLVLGGDHSLAAATWKGVGRALGTAPGLIWIDAHLGATLISMGVIVAFIIIYNVMKIVPNAGFSPEDYSSTGRGR